MMTENESGELMKKKKGPGKHYRQGISLFEIGGMFPDEESAENRIRDSTVGQHRHALDPRQRRAYHPGSR